MSQVESRTHKTKFLHPVARKSHACSMRDAVLVGNTEPSGKDFWERSILASLYLEAAAHWSDPLPASYGLGRDCSCEKTLSASRSQRKLRDLTRIPGKQLAQWVFEAVVAGMTMAGAVHQQLETDDAKAAR